MNYSEALELIDSNPRLKRRKLAHNTYLERRKGGELAVRLHDTDVVTMLPDNTFRLDSGGWRTVTTKERINRFSPARLSQEKRVWYLFTNGCDTRVLFDDGVVIDGSGQVVSGAGSPDKEKAIRKEINAFIGELKKLKTLPEPGGGDCWGCSMVAADGSRPMCGGCVVDHIKEKYIHGSLILRALQEKGITSTGIGRYWQRFNEGDKWGRASVIRAVRDLCWREVRRGSP